MDNKQKAYRTAVETFDDHELSLCKEYENTYNKCLFMNATCIVIR